MWHKNSGAFALIASKFKKYLCINYFEVCVRYNGRTEFGIQCMIFSFLVNVCVECFSLHGIFRSSLNGDTEVHVYFYVTFPLSLCDFI